MQLKRTTERVSEDHSGLTLADHFIFLCHIATYRFALDHVRGADVLDLGCGTGFGSRMLADAARSVVGVDVAPEAVSFSQARYGGGDQGSLEFRQIGALPENPLPFDDDTFDVVTCFQVIEHIVGVERFLREIRRVLRPGGVVIFATPDRRWRLYSWQQPWNRFHVTEWEPETLQPIIAGTFTDVEMLGLTAPAKMLEVELARCNKLRRTFIPLTLPFVPDRVRTVSLAGITHARDAVRGLVRTVRGERDHVEFKGREDDILIAPNVAPSTNIIVLARKQADVGTSA